MASDVGGIFNEGSRNIGLFLEAEIGRHELDELLDLVKREARARSKANA